MRKGYRRLDANSQAGQRRVHGPVHVRVLPSCLLLLLHAGGTPLQLMKMQQAPLFLLLLWACLALQAAAQATRPTQIPTASVPCLDSFLVLPGAPGETLRSTVSQPSNNTRGPGVCVRLTGATTLLRLDSRATFYEAKGTFTFWWAGGNPSVCAGRSDAYMPALKQYLSRYNLYLAGSTWNSSQCCTATTPCNTTDIQIKHSPVLSSSTPPTDWARIEGYQFNTQDPRSRPFILPEDLYNTSLRQQSSALACEAVCARTPGCATYLFTPSAQQCTFFLSEPSLQFPLVPCADNGCQLGFRLGGSCGVSPSAGISHYGKRWVGWAPGWLMAFGQNTPDSFLPPWAADGIPAVSQGQYAESIAECNCRCVTTGNCTGYTWLAENSTCYMLRNIQTFIDPDDDPNPGTTLGRVVSAVPPPICLNNAFRTAISWTDAVITQANNSRITTFSPNPQNVTYEACYDACAADPACMAADLDMYYDDDILRTNRTVQCFLQSTVSGYLLDKNGSGVFQLQRCEELPVPRLPVRNLSPSASWAVLSSADVLPRTFLVPLSPAPEQQLIPASTAQECFGLCRNRTNCGMAIYNPASNTCFPALLVGMNSSALRALTPQQALTRQGCTDATGCVITMRTPGSCGLVASSGIVASGMQWATWALGSVSGLWGNASSIEPRLQNRTVVSASDCGCLCQQSSTCIGYMYLGDVRSCWLQNRINFTAVLEPDSSPETLAARLAVPVGMVPDCSNASLITIPDTVPYSLSSARIRRRPNPFLVRNTGECNAACLLEPFCLFYVVADTTANRTHCNLYSSVVGSGLTSFRGGAFGTVARCPFVPAPLVDPSDRDAPAEVGPSPVLTPSKQLSAGLGIGVGAGVGGAVLLAGIVGLVWLRKRRAQKRKDAYNATNKEQPEGLGPDMKMILGGALNDSPSGLHTLNSGPLMSLASNALPAQISTKELAAAAGMIAGDPFLQSVAPSYRWCSDPLTDMVAVEEGVNAGALAAAAAADQADCAGPSTPTHVDCAGPPPVQLTMAEVQQQIEIMAHGMIDRGATAVVFKCRWPSRFGPNALLAIKCMRDPYAYHMKEMLESFAYEANVLSKFRHENIVRMYGYCLEAPVVCIILELLPGSVKDLLYGSRAAKATSINPWAKRPFLSLSGMNNDSQSQNNSPPVSQLNSQAGKAPTTEQDVSGQQSPRPAGAKLPKLDKPTPADDSAQAKMRDVGKLDLPSSSKEQTMAQSPFAISSVATGAEGTPKAGLIPVQTDGMSADLSSVATSPSGTPRMDSLFVPDPGNRRPSKMPSRLGAKLDARPQSAGGQGPPTGPLSGDTEVSLPALSASELLRLGADIAAGLVHLHARQEVKEGGSDSAYLSLASELINSRSTWGTNASTIDDGALDRKLAMGGRVVHRDLKPANVLLNSLGRAKISDFGLAREHQNTTVYTQHVGAGTLTYMAPELLSGSSMANKITDKVDIYSLGIMLWEMATRTTPWKGYSDVQIQAMVTSGQRPPTPVSGQQASMSASHVNDTLLRQLPAYNSLIKGCWNPRAPRRPAAAAVHKTLLKLMEQVPKEEKPNTLSEETRNDMTMTN